MQYQLEQEQSDAYLASTHYIDWQNPLILQKAESLFAGCQNDREKIKAAFVGCSQAHISGSDSPFR